MRYGAPIERKFASADDWIQFVKSKGYTAAYAPVDTSSDMATRKEYRDSAIANDIVIAEVGAWSNPLDPNPAVAKAAFEKCCASLQLADDLGALCSVNIAGSCNGQQWDGPHPNNFDQNTFDRIVHITRDIIDTVSPKTAVFALETMPWIFPSTPEEYLRLVKAIDRKAFGIHMDPVNMIITPAIAYNTSGFLRECFDLLGPQIVSCHAKDIHLHNDLTVHLSECPPGTGVLDYTTFIDCVRNVNPEIPIMLEHLPSEQAYDDAFVFLRSQVYEATKTHTEA
ncbi:sugar phosphate isomerase/epimerase [Rhodophyticola sp. CCM32]|uniref:sugar phosphate isomerase/epimerase family protein n=1 Tax=Rhodophyticola sp. CCM32 TaxID=2916397 RepID=UPI00107F5E3B|nr:TIM barrel protein [Rhodophyticola sp. CCM32]QBY01227.1 sugar phosphate isomerase/epimerase [Rhodophyticola sp. CCM32]